MCGLLHLPSISPSFYLTPLTSFTSVFLFRLFFFFYLVKCYLSRACFGNPTVFPLHLMLITFSFPKLYLLSCHSFLFLSSFVIYIYIYIICIPSCILTSFINQLMNINDINVLLHFSLSSHCHYILQ